MTNFTIHSQLTLRLCVHLHHWQITSYFLFTRTDRFFHFPIKFNYYLSCFGILNDVTSIDFPHEIWCVIKKIKITSNDECFKIDGRNIWHFTMLCFDYSLSNIIIKSSILTNCPFVNVNKQWQHRQIFIEFYNYCSHNINLSAAFLFWKREKKIHLTFIWS